MTTPIALRLDQLTEKGIHRNLCLRLGAYRHVCDSYYLDIDESPTASPDLGAALARLLDQWRSQAEELREKGGTAYLPYDFSDQCTAWLRVSSTDGRNAEVQAGWSLLEGYRIVPSDYVATSPEITDFDPIVNARIECSLSDLARHIATNAESFKPSRL
ncbi:hypothetical protein [Streptomyces sp. NPDC046385]|uniref:hypothetical protein n=1 Tax=Streptomyces sp. NPDC046385 TaxID=3154918 RepID=UPI003411280C